MRFAVRVFQISKPELLYAIGPGNLTSLPPLWQDEPVFDSLAPGSYGIYVSRRSSLLCNKRLGAFEVKSTDPKVSLGNDTLVCRNTKLILDAGNPGLTYTWNNGKDSQMISAIQPGMYHVVVTDTLGCEGVDTITISNVEMPHGDSLRATVNLAKGSFVVSAPTFTERFNWNFGDGQTQNNGGASTEHTYTAVGKYTVKVALINQFGCDTFMLTKEIEIKMLNTGVKENVLTDLSVYPNPVKGQVKIALADYTAAEVIVHNMYGAEVYKSALTSGEINVQDWAEGVYFLTITRGQQAGVVKVVVQK